MKKIIYIVFLSLFVFASGCKKTTDNTALCNNGVLDGGETEIDCGGPCTACPPAATFTAKLNGLWFTATSTPKTLYWTQNGPSLSIRASNPITAISVGLFFSTPTINQAENLNSASVNYNDNYIIQPRDSSSITVTSIDTLRKTISGTFRFTATAPPSNPMRVDSGTFTNLRIYQVQ